MEIPSGAVRSLQAVSPTNKGVIMKLFGMEWFGGIFWGEWALTGVDGI